MQVSYSRRWNFIRNRPIDPLTEDEAKQRDTAGELYSVVVGDPAAPDRIIEVVRPDHIGVWFFDPRQRQSLNYVFRRTDDETMFLHNVTRWGYPDDGARTLTGANVIEEIEYEPDGIAHHEVRDDTAGETTRKSLRDINLGINWEPVPAFGDWQSIVRYNRDAAADPQQLT